MNVYLSGLAATQKFAAQSRALVLAATLAVGVAIAAYSLVATPNGVPTDREMPAFALKWFAHMQAGETDLSQYTTSYRSQLNADAVHEMSRYLNRYGASPFHAEIMQKGVSGNQTFYVMKLLFPRGDAASMLFSFNATGKITGAVVENMAGD